MKIIESYLTKNPCYQAGRKINVQGLMLHSVGCSQPKASVFINSWNRADYGTACVHGFIDAETGVVYQTLPWNYRGWHCASGPKGSGNSTHIGVEMCEPECIQYGGGGRFGCSDREAALAVVKRTYDSAVELFAMLCEKFGLDPLGDGVIISHTEGHERGIASDHGDPEHLWEGLETGYTMDGFRKDVWNALRNEVTGVEANGLQAEELSGLTPPEVVEKVGPLFTADQRKNGIPASVSLAQFILESGYGKSELAVKANNCFGMKKNLSGNTWKGSSWDGESIYEKQTKECLDGKTVTVTAEFRKYACVEDSVADHSAYLIGAMNGKKKRYNGICGVTDCREAVDIICRGGYAASPDYGEELLGIIKRWKLKKFDAVPSGKKTFPVRVGIDDLNIRKEPGTDKQKTGKYTGKGVFTIVEVRSGKGSKIGWGRLKSGAGWVSMDYCERV